MQPDIHTLAYEEPSIDHVLRKGAEQLEKISVVLPAYNEAECIANNIRRTREVLHSVISDLEIIVVDDGSTDGTGAIASIAAVSVPQVRVIRYEKNCGKGAALARGGLAARGQYVVFLDADMDLRPEQLPLLIERMHHGGIDALIGSKHHPLSRIENYPAHRRLYSQVYYALVRVLFGLPLRDTQTGLKIFRRELLLEVLPRVTSSRFAFDLELLATAHKMGYRLADAPVTLEFQRAGRISWRDVLKTFVDTMVIFKRMRLANIQKAVIASAESFERVAEDSVA